MNDGVIVNYKATMKFSITTPSCSSKNDQLSILVNNNVILMQYVISLTFFSFSLH